MQKLLRRVSVGRAVAIPGDLLGATTRGPRCRGPRRRAPNRAVPRGGAQGSGNPVPYLGARLAGAPCEWARPARVSSEAAATPLRGSARQWQSGAIASLVGTPWEWARLARVSCEAAATPTRGSARQWQPGAIARRPSCRGAVGVGKAGPCQQCYLREGERTAVATRCHS